MKNSLRYLLGSVLLVTSILTFGCGGGGGGGGVLSHDSGWEGISGPLDFSKLALPSGYTTSGWPVAADATSFSIQNFSSNSTAAILLANFTSSSQTIILSANQPFAASVVATRRADARNVDFGRISRFYAGLRSLEKMNSETSHDVHGSSMRAARRHSSPGSTYEFQVYMGPDADFASVTGTLYRSEPLPDSSGGSLRFYRDETIPDNPTVRKYYDDIIAGWNDIYRTMHNTFGVELQAGDKTTGIDLGKDIYVLITPSMNQYDDRLAGFFYSGDLYPPERITPSNTNQMKIFYLNFRMDGENRLTPEIVQSTMAHEFQHMIFFSNRIKKSMPSNDDWLNETLSAYAESACDFKVTNGKNQSKATLMQQYFECMNQVPLVQNRDWGSEAQYGQVALFGEWLAEKYPDAIKALYASSKTGMEAVEAVTTKSFETVYAEWMLAMYLNTPNNTNDYGFNDIEWNTPYSFGVGLDPVTLTGPINNMLDNQILPANLSPRQITLMPFACFMLEFKGGGDGNSLEVQFQMNNGVTVFALKK